MQQNDFLRKGKGDFRCDPIHANHIQDLDRDISGIAHKGDWLVTIRHLNKIIIVDPRRDKIVWEWGENGLSLPHHAVFLEGDKILLFDNGVVKKSSRVIIVDLRSRKIVWQYGQKPGQELFTYTRGEAQRLPNGNILIAEGETGRSLEVTHSGEVVWEWYADFLTEGKRKGKRKDIIGLQRIPYDFFKGVEFNYGKVEPSEKKRKKK